MKNNNELGIYIHIPFCMQKCIYCDFLSAPADDKTKSSYVKALINEIALSEAGLDKNVTSIFIGGGTPSAINAEYIKDILEAVKQRYRVDGNAEITIECNPGTINSEKARIYREAGINRISFGLQSTDDKELRMLGRIHTFEQFKNSLAIARNAGFTNINIDLMSALPGQTIESFTRVLKEAVSLNTEHISVYSLIIEEGTRLYDNIDNYPDIPDDDDDRKMYALTKEILGQAGYERYEISNYAKAGYECKHNLKYWDRTDYIGFGIGAASLCNHKRYTNISDINNYIKALCVEYADNKESNKECIVENIKNIQETLKNSLEIKNNCQDLKENIEVLTLEDEMAEYMFLGLRKSAGVDICDFKDIFGKDIYSVYKEQIKDNIAKGLLWQNGTRIALTDRGIDISNTVMSDFV